MANDKQDSSILYVNKSASNLANLNKLIQRGQATSKAKRWQSWDGAVSLGFKGVKKDFYDEIASNGGCFAEKDMQREGVFGNGMYYLNVARNFINFT